MSTSNNSPSLTAEFAAVPTYVPRAKRFSHITLRVNMDPVRVQEMADSLGLSSINSPTNISSVAFFRAVKLCIRLYQRKTSLDVVSLEDLHFLAAALTDDGVLDTSLSRSVVLERVKWRFLLPPDIRELSPSEILSADLELLRDWAFALGCSPLGYFP